MWRVTMDVLVLVADTESEYVAVFDKKANCKSDTESYGNIVLLILNCWMN